MIHKKFEEIVPNEGHMGMIFGDVRTGKSCLGYGLLEHLSVEYNRDAYVFGLPREKAYLLPPSMTPIYSLDDLAENSIVIFDEAYISFYSRMSSSEINKMMDTLAGLVGQKNILAMYITQQTRRLEIGVVSSVGWIFSKKPSLLQSRFDRKELRGIIKEVYGEFSRLVPPEGVSKKDYQKRCTYVISGDFEGMIEDSNTPPSFWSEELSEAFKGVPLSSGTEKEEKGGEFRMNEVSINGLKEEKKAVTAEERELKKKILDFVEEHGWYIHPKKSLDTHVKKVIELGGACPCQAARSCPCPEAEEDIVKRGACVCTIIVNDDYLEAWDYKKTRIERIKER